MSNLKLQFPKEITITPTFNNLGVIQTLTFAPNDALRVIPDGQLKDTITIENKKGAALPSTGGIGTTIFYIVGGALMVGALILLLTKKKMANK